MKKLSIIVLISSILIAMVLYSCLSEKAVEPEADDEVVIEAINTIFQEEGTQEYLGDFVLGMPWPGEEFMTKRGYEIDPAFYGADGYYHPERQIRLMFYMYPDVIDSSRLVYIQIEDSPVKFLGMSPPEGNFAWREDLPVGSYRVWGQSFDSENSVVGIELYSTNKTDQVLPVY